VGDRHELEEHVPAVKQALKYDSIFWIGYPKKSSGVDSDLCRDTLWNLMKKRGLRAVSPVMIDSVWSAARSRPPEMAKSKK
jgi:hypothetical protein